VEAHRGELAYYIRSNGTNCPERVKIRTPSVVNNNSILPMVLGETIADVPIILASIDPCFSCTDRLMIINNRTGVGKVVSLSEIKRRWKR
jgi:NADH-quinone oxidoreductase subunit D